MANASVDLLTRACAHLTGRAENRDAVTELDSWQTEDWRAALLDVPLDERAYEDRFGVGRAAELDALWIWWDASEPDGRVSAATKGYLGFFLLTLTGMHRSDRMRYHGEAYDGGEIDGRPADERCASLVAHTGVREAVKALYRPADDDADAVEIWDEIDFSTMAFHRQGTTSIIITVDSDPPNKAVRPTHYALKCLIYPYLRIPAIVKATRAYEREFGGVRPEGSPLVTVFASYDSWVLMEFIKGTTLTDYLRAAEKGRKDPKSEITRPVDLKQLRAVGAPLLGAMSVLAANVGYHNDLTPSNIIVQVDEDNPDVVKIRLIDLGVNFLHTRTIVGAQSGESVYVAPEVKTSGTGGYRADLYSVGMVLIAIGGIPHSAEGTVPDQFYVASVGLARLLEDLVDADPRQRLVVSGIEAGLGRYTEIRDLFMREIEVLEAAEKGKPKTAYQRFKGLLPAASVVSRQREIAKVRRKQAKATDKAKHPRQAHHLRQANGLKYWAIACALMSWVTLALVLTWWSRDLDLFWQAKYVEIANWVFNRSGNAGIPLLDDVRAADYVIPAAWDNLPVRIIALAYAIPGLRLYMNIFADMTPHSAYRRRGWRGVKTAAASFMMRASAVYPTVYILLPTLVQRRWWVIFSPLGIITVATMISACLWFALDANRRARAWNDGKGLSTVPKGEIMTLQRLVSWQPAAWLYALPVVIIGIFLYNDRLQDELMYAIAIALINIGIWTFKNTGSDAPYVRAGLTRAILAAERLDVLEDRKAKAAKRNAPKPRAADAAAPVPEQEAVG
ncbi:protein kinase [Glycomyces sp. NPDC048151]|uniref:protein kinase domain-containing protein n=1 Tax=Glycomyces sp. NPDC048151 TaxID=3364002 RepID=UPI0037152191